jgi:multidrug efflux pump subunit AcrA (membrane-fusion protein)
MKSNFLPVLGAIFAAIIFCLHLPTASFASLPSTSEKPKGIVFVHKTEAAPIFDQLIYPAKVIPQVNTVILAETDGIVTKIFAPLGQSVKNRQRMMLISHTDPIYQYAPMAVVASINGVVSSMDVTEGTQVIKGQRLAAVTDPKKIKISIEVPAQDLAFLTRGMLGEFRPMGSTAQVPVKIRGLSPFIDPATGTASCEIEVDGKDKTLLTPGLLGQASFKANQHEGISIPDYALFYKGSDTYVRVIEGDRAKQVPVVLGRRQRGFVEITKGLAANALLVERASRYVGDGEAVTVETATEAGTAQN